MQVNNVKNHLNEISSLNRNKLKWFYVSYAWNIRANLPKLHNNIYKYT